MTPGGLRLHPEDVAALADLIVERLVPRLLSDPAAAHLGAKDASVLLTAGEVGARFGVSAEWVRDHQSELGVVRLGDGPRPRLRFDPERVAEALTRRTENERSEQDEGLATTLVPSPGGGSSAGSGLDSLPVRELQPRPTATKVAGRRWSAPGPATRGMASPRPERTPAGSSSAACERPRKEA